MFNDWRENDTKHRQLTKKYSIGNIGHYIDNSIVIVNL